MIEDASLIYLIDPLNPLGSRYERDELQAIVDLARATGSLIIHDCTYRHFATGHTLAAELYPEGTFTTYSFSKWLGLAGLRVGAVVAQPELLERLTRVPSNPLGANIQGQRAAIAGLKVKDAWLQRLRTVNAARQEIVIAAIAAGAVGEVVVDPSHGNFLAVDVSAAGWHAEALCDALLDDDVFIRPGTYQSPAFGERFVKISTSVPVEWAERFAVAWSGLSHARAEPRGVRRAPTADRPRRSGRRRPGVPGAPGAVRARAGPEGRADDQRLRGAARGARAGRGRRAGARGARRSPAQPAARRPDRLQGQPLPRRRADRQGVADQQRRARRRPPRRWWQRLLDAGLVVIGRTTTPEFGWKGTGISPRTGVTRNPWDPRKNSGGSSAGSGATVGSGAVPIATGTDAGGSVRIPASFCGAVGLKPTLGAIPVWPGTVNESLSHAGPITRSVGDARAVLELTRGPDPRDPQSYFSGARPSDRAARCASRWSRAPFGIAPDATVAPVFEDALAGAAVRGIAEFAEAELPAALPRDVFEALWVTGRGLGFQHLFDEHAAIMDPGLVRLGGLADGYSLADYQAALGRRRAFNAAMFAFLEQWDLVVMPTHADHRVRRRRRGSRGRRGRRAAAVDHLDALHLRVQHHRAAGDHDPLRPRRRRRCRWGCRSSDRGRATQRVLAFAQECERVLAAA